MLSRNIKKNVLCRYERKTKMKYFSSYLHPPGEEYDYELYAIIILLFSFW